MTTEPRTPEELRAHYDIETRLADQLRQATRAERLVLYPKLYDELYRLVPFLKTDPVTTDPVLLASTLRLFKSFSGAGKMFLEIGAGNLALSRLAAPYFKRVFALDVSQEFASTCNALPKNVQFVLSDGLSVPLPADTVDFAYSHQLMEHLHPDDAREQLQHIIAALKPGGKYLCITPHRFAGPHDISKHFNSEATGFHLHEYTIAELTQIFYSANFRKVYSLVGVRGYVIALPPRLQIWFERLLAALPQQWCRTLSRTLLCRNLLAIRLVGVK